MLAGVCNVFKAILDDEDGTSGFETPKYYEMLFLFTASFFGFRGAA